MSPAPNALFPTSATGVAVLPNGDVAVSGGNTTKFEVSLYDPSGSLLWSLTPFTGAANAVAITPGGNIVAAGYQSNGTCGGQQPVVTEYTPAGLAPVSPFPVLVPCPGSSGAFHGVAVEPDGTIVAAGTELAVTNTQTFVSWITGAGVLSATKTDPAQSDGLAVAAPVSGNDVYVAGDNSATQQASIAAFSSSTGLDTTWGSSGVAVLPGKSASGIAVSGSPGTIFTAGLGSGSAGFVAAVNSTGTSITWSDNSTGTLNSVAFQPAGSVLTVAGYLGPKASEQMFVEQFNAGTGAHNGAFGSGGVMTASLGGPSSLSALAAQADGKVVGAGGGPITPGTASLALARFYGPSISVETPPLYQTSTTGNHVVSFRADLDEPLFSMITPGFSAPGATVNGPVTFGPGVTSVIVTVTVNVTATTRDQFQWLNPNAGNGVAPALNGSSGAAYVTIQPIPAYPGYRMVARDGGIFTFGSAGFYGSEGGHPLNAPIVGMASTLNGGGYWLVGSDGGIFTFGNAGFYGSMGGHSLNAPIVGMATDPATGGYWMVASDGGIFSFNAPFFGSMGGQHLNAPIVGIAATADGGGYWMVARDGGIFTFGDAAFLGSMGGHYLNAPVVGMAPYPSVSPYQQGYWLVASDGGIFTFGAAPFRGSMGGHYLVAPILGITPTANGQGYWMVAGDGGIFTFNAGFYGSEGGHYLNAPVVGMSR